MNKINIFFLSLILMVSNSCDLDLYPLSSVSSDSYWRAEDDAKAAVNGLYSRMRSQISTHQWIYWFDGRSCIVGPGRTPGGIVQYNANELSSTMTDTNWNGLYSIISQANSIINNIDTIEFADKTTRDELLAQAYFFRAWCYYNLVRLWGDVPKITNFISSLDDPQLYPERSPKSEIWELIKEDIGNADNLYKSKESESCNRVSRAAILMLKTDISLWLYKVEHAGDEFLKQAETAVTEILSYPGYGILDNYSDVFDIEENNEIIFSLYYDVLENSSQYGTLFAQVSNVPASHKNNPIPCGNTTSQPMAFSQVFMDEYRNRTPGDTRAEYLCNDTEVGGTTYRWTKKYMGELIGGRREFDTDMRIYRYSEAVLFYSEILAEKNDIPNAVRQLNRVVERAYGTDSYYPENMTKEHFLDALLDERIIEFAGECKSWFDMIRFGEVFERVSTLKGRENDKEGNILLMPVFHETINRNSKIIQTPGYDE